MAAWARWSLAARRSNASSSTKTPSGRAKNATGNNPAAKQNLAEVRPLARSRAKSREAEQLADQARSSPCRKRMPPYQPLGDLHAAVHRAGRRSATTAANSNWTPASRGSRYDQRRRPQHTREVFSFRRTDQVIVAAADLCSQRGQPHLIAKRRSHRQQRRPHARRRATNRVVLDRRGHRRAAERYPSGRAKGRRQTLRRAAMCWPPAGAPACEKAQKSLSSRPTAATLLHLAAATKFTAIQDPLAHCETELAKSRPETLCHNCAPPTFAIISACSAASPFTLEPRRIPDLPTNERLQPRAERARADLGLVAVVLPIRALFADRQQPPRHAALPTLQGHLERTTTRRPGTASTRSTSTPR
jgi:hypothetical protein